jgi:hypothetical protein
MAQVYDIRTINGIVPPVPSVLNRARYDIDLESYTTASGLLIRNKVAEKNKFFLEFPYMNKTEMQVILAMLDSDVLFVQYEDIIDGTLVTGNFYRGDIETSIYMIKNEANTEVIYNPFKINLIEY